ncbi:hypothetical protein KIPB_014902, partial [Kipferlia bialata]
TGSLIMYVQQYLTLGAMLMADMPVYEGAVNKWYSLRKGVKRMSRVRLLDVLIDPDVSDSIHGIIVGIAPTIQGIRHHSVHISLQRASVALGGDESLRGLMGIPNKATYMQKPLRMPIPTTIEHLCHPGEYHIQFAPLTMFNQDGYIVAEAEGESDVWEVTAITSGCRDAQMADVLRLRQRVPLSRVRGLLPRDTRASMRDAVQADTEAAIADLEGEPDMESFWFKRTYHAQYVA